MQKKAIHFLKKVMTKIDHPLFPVILALLSAIDHFILIIPSDGILITSIFIRKKKWPRNALSISLGSTLGAILLVFLVHHYGLEEIILHFPKITHSSIWPYSQKLLTDYGLWGLFFMMLSPFMQQPMLLLIGLTNHPLKVILVVILAGKSLKYILISWCASKFPEVIRKSKLLGAEIDEVLDLMGEKKEERNLRDPLKD